MVNLARYINAQHQAYAIALKEICNGKKTSHWMWYIFPQLAGLGHSEMAKYYAISSLTEAEEYLAHPLLGNRLVKISTALLELESSNASEVLGSPDDLKLHSCMTLFASLKDSPSVFKQVLDKFYNGEMDLKTLALLTNIIE